MMTAERRSSARDAAQQGIAVLGLALLAVGVSCGGSQTTPDADDGWAEGGDADTTDVVIDWPEPDHGELPPDSCGDGVLDPGEECDDGNRMNGDGCDWSCRLGDGEFPTGPPDPDAGRLAEEAGISYIDFGAPPSRGPAFVDEIPLEWTGEAYATVWVHESPDPGDSRAQATFVRFDTAGNRIGGWWTYHFASAWSTFDLAWSGSAFGLCLTDDSDGLVRFVVLDPDGKPRSDPFVIGARSPLELLAIPLRLIADGAGYAGIWRGLLFARLDAVGRHRDAGPRSLDSLLSYSSTLAWSGTSYLLTWTTSSGTAEPSQVHYLVLDADLAPLAGPRILGPVDGESGNRSRGVWLGDRFVVAWMGPDSGDPMGPVWTRPLYVARFDRQGRLLGPPTTEPETSPAIPASVTGFSAAAGANSIAVAVAALGGVGDPHVELRLIRFDREGIFIERVELLDMIYETGVDPTGSLGIAFDGSGFGVVVS